MERNASLTPDGLAALFAAQHGRLQIADFLAAKDAAVLAAELSGSARWTRLVNAGAKTFEIPADEYDAMDSAAGQALDSALFAEARESFRYRYDVIRVSDDIRQRDADSSALADLARLMSGDATLAFLAGITGVQRLCYADAQATRYRAGDFLNRHDDEKPGAHRALAYVLGLSPDWRAEWGGLLLFLDSGGDVVQTFRPRFNTLTLFSVPQSHSVSFIAPYAGCDRLSVTGWIRTERPSADL